MGVWVGPDGESVIAGVNPGSYSGGIETDLSAPASRKTGHALADIEAKMADAQQQLSQARQNNQPPDPKDLEEPGAPAK